MTVRFLADMAVLYLTLEVATDRLINWQAQQISHLVCSLAGQRCLEA